MWNSRSGDAGSMLVANQENQKGITALLGLQDQANYGNGECKNCISYHNRLVKKQELENHLLIENKILRETLQQFEQQNKDILNKSSKTYKEYGSFIAKLNQQLMLRDQAIQKLEQDLNDLDQIIQKMQTDHQNQLYQYERKFCELEQQNQQWQNLYDQTVARNKQQKQDQIRELKSTMYKQLGVKSKIQRKKRQQQLKWQVEKLQLNKQVKELQQLITAKEEIIKKFSKSNDQLRLQLMDMKAKKQIDQLTSFTTDKKIYSNEQHIRLENENKDLKKDISDFKRQLEKMKKQNYKMKKEKNKYRQKLQDKEKQLIKSLKGSRDHIDQDRSVGKVKRQVYSDKYWEQSLMTDKNNAYLRLTKFIFLKIIGWMELCNRSESSHIDFERIQYWKSYISQTKKISQNSIEQLSQQLTTTLQSLISSQQQLPRLNLTQSDRYQQKSSNFSKNNPKFYLESRNSLDSF